MMLHVTMEGQISLAARTIEAALASTVLDDCGAVSLAELAKCTGTVQSAVQAVRGPESAVYVAWDSRGRCRYVGSVHRPSARAAVRDRIREHLVKPDRRASWYAVTILPLRHELDVTVVRACEGWVARRLHPLDGGAHPMTPTELALRDLLAG